MPASYRTSPEVHALRESVRLHSVLQGHVFRRADLSAWGFDATVVQAMVRKGHWRKIRYGVYADCEIVDVCRALSLLQCSRVASASPEVY